MPEPAAAARAEIDTGGRGLRVHAARGTLINSAYQVFLALLGFARRVLIAAFLTREEYGIWGIIVTTLLTLSWLKQLGISDKYVQQNEPDQEAAYQKAFTLELMASSAFFALLCLVLPIYGLAYGHSEIIVPGIVMAASILISAFESPIWIPYRRMQFVRQRALTSVDVVTAFVVTIGLGAAGMGYWCLVIGSVAGSIAGAVVCTITCPYKIRLRYSRETLREYLSFSWPLFSLSLTSLIGIQAVLLVATHSVGLAGVGTIALAASISQFADRVDDIVSTTIYPAVCAVADRPALMFEAFMTSNRLAVMWGMSFGLALALFAGDLVHYVFGEKWRDGVGVIAALGVIAAFRQIGFNWQIFMRAVGNTRPMFVAAVTNLLSIAVLTIPLIVAFGLPGYAAGMGAAVAVQILQRGYYLKQLFPQHRPLAYVARAMLPSIPPTALILLSRAVIGGDRPAWRVVLEGVVYGLVTVASAWFLERPLITEMVSYLRGGGGLRSKFA